MSYSPENWARLWKAVAKNYREQFRVLLTDYRDLFAELASLAHAEKLEDWLQGFRRRVVRRKWRTARVWRAWYLLKTREFRLERLRKLQAPQVLITNELRMVAEAKEGVMLALILAKVKSDDSQTC